VEQAQFNHLHPGDRVWVRVNRMIADRAGARDVDVLPGQVVAVKRSSDPTLLNREEVYRIATEFGIDWYSAREIRYPRGNS
jgi:hypothetical protein